MESTPELECTDLDAFYGRLQVLHGISLHVGAGETVALLGANGAGKTTLLRAVTGAIRTKGRVSLRGKRAQFLQPSDAARAGVAHVPEGRGTMNSLSVEDNLKIGAHLASRRDLHRRLASVYEQFPRLSDRRKQLAGSLSGGEQQMLALGRGLMLQPRVLLLDEPSLGLAPALAEAFYEELRDLQSRDDLSILLVEQNAALALDLAARVYVLETGTLAATNTAQGMRESAEIADLYFGGRN